MNHQLNRNRGAASDFIIEKYVELILIEILRRNWFQENKKLSGLLAGLSDPLIAKSLFAMHRDVLSIIKRVYDRLYARNRLSSKSFCLPIQPFVR